MEHINVELDKKTIPDYSTHSENFIKGFFGKYSFLSNFFQCKNGVYFKGLKFPSTENAYQAAKFKDKYLIDFKNITATNSKKLAATLKFESTYIENEWLNKKYDIMFGLVFQKFNIDKKLLNQLLDTRNKYLEETNSWNDTYWGVCNGIGENNLGRILMRVRELLK